jgi:hypothetical protein
MAAKPLVGAQRAFQIDLLPDAESAQRGARECLGYGFDDKAVCADSDGGLAGPVDIDAVAYGQVG